MWLGPTDRSSPARQIAHSGENSPYFDPRAQILFRAAEGGVNYLERMNWDGSGRRKVAPYPIIQIEGVSPSRRWVMASVPLDSAGAAPVAISTGDGSSVRVCATYCGTPRWSPDERFLFVRVEEATRTSTGRSLAIRAGPGESLPVLPPGGIAPMSNPSVVPGAQSDSPRGSDTGERSLAFRVREYNRASEFISNFGTLGSQSLDDSPAWTSLAASSSTPAIGSPKRTGHESSQGERTVHWRDLIPRRPMQFRHMVIAGNRLRLQEITA